MLFHYRQIQLITYNRIVGSVVECSPTTRAARVRFPDDAIRFRNNISDINFIIKWSPLIKFSVVFVEYYDFC